LAFIPSTEVESAFLEIMAVCPNFEVGHEFSDYILTTYIDLLHCFLLTYEH